MYSQTRQSGIVDSLCWLSDLRAIDGRKGQVPGMPLQSLESTYTTFAFNPFIKQPSRLYGFSGAQSKTKICAVPGCSANCFATWALWPSRPKVAPSFHGSWGSNTEPLENCSLMLWFGRKVISPPIITLWLLRKVLACDWPWWRLNGWLWEIKYQVTWAALPETRCSIIHWALSWACAVVLHPQTALLCKILSPSRSLRFQAALASGTYFYCITTSLNPNLWPNGEFSMTS